MRYGFKIFIDENFGICISETSGIKEGRIIITLTKEEIESSNFSNLAYQIGGAALGFLKVISPEALKSIDVVARPPGSFDDSEFEVALYLIGRSLFEKCSDSVPAIEFLLKKASEDSGPARDYFLHTWPAVRARLVDL